MTEQASMSPQRDRIAPRYGQSAERPGAPWDSGDDPRITAIEAFVTAPDDVNLVIVRVRTSEDGLYGYGCATFTQRAHAVVEVIERYLAPLLVGRSAGDSSDIWQVAYVDSYWRGGPVLHSAIAGVDEALWDIRGRRAGLPVWQLLGGRVRSHAEAYTHASGRDLPELLDQVEACVDAGYRHVRCQVTVPGTSTYGAAQHSSTDSFWEPERYLDLVPEMLAAVNDRFGPEVRVLHDVHERLTPQEMARLLTRLDESQLFFIEDPVAPEDVAWLPRLRDLTTIPLAYGELVTDIADFVPLVTGRQIDVVRAHLSAIGGLTPAIRLASLAEMHGVGFAWHGPRDVSPIGHAVSLALDLASPAFTVHEHFEFSEGAQEVFPGTFTTTGGVIGPSDQPGLGVDFDAERAKKFPPVDSTSTWHYSRVRRRGGAVQRP